MYVKLNKDGFLYTSCYVCRVTNSDQSWTERLESRGMVVCKDCGHVAQNVTRHAEHVKEARHVNTFRFLAYRFIARFSFQNIFPTRVFREPKKKTTWLKIWYNTIEKVEKENPWALAFNEEEENESRSKRL